MPETDRIPSNIYPALYYDDAPAAIEWLCRAFGFRRRLVVPGPDGRVVHAELSVGPGVIMIGSARPDEGFLGPRALPGVSQAVTVRVEDPDAHCARAKKAGAVIIRDLRDEEFGARGYMARDPEGHVWYFATYSPGAHWEQG